MAPRKVKTQGKRNVVKIKSKSNKGKPPLKSLKKSKKSKKAIESLKLLNKIPGNLSFKKKVPDWYKYQIHAESVTNVSDLEEEPPPNSERKYSDSEISEECNCDYSNNTDNGILKRKTSSSSVVANYIKSGMDQVASFIVESAIRFGEQHGVVVPDKKNPNLYEFTPTDKRFGEKFRKIRFKIPDKPLDYKNAKKAMWKSQKDNESPDNTRSTSKTTMPDSKTESLENILPILEKLKEEEDFVNDDMDSEKTESEGEDRYKKRIKEKKNRNRNWSGAYKSDDSMTNKVTENDDSVEGSKWKKFRRDSLELGRRRLKAAACPEKDKSVSPTPS